MALLAGEVQLAASLHSQADLCDRFEIVQRVTIDRNEGRRRSLDEPERRSLREDRCGRGHRERSEHLGIRHQPGLCDGQRFGDR
jgi:hypothetical protein